MLEYFEVRARAIDPAAHPYIARLTAPYVAQRRPRDRYFRKVAALLMNVDAETMRQLVFMFRGSAKVLSAEAAEPPGVQIRQMPLAPPQCAVEPNPHDIGTVTDEIRLGLDVIEEARLASDADTTVGAFVFNEVGPMTDSFHRLSTDCV